MGKKKCESESVRLNKKGSCHLNVARAFFFVKLCKDGMSNITLNTRCGW